MTQIKTDRGSVRVIDRDCARRPCLHVHWSRFGTEAKERSDGSKVVVYPLVCIRNEDHGCPNPLPEPR